MSVMTEEVVDALNKLPDPLKLHCADDHRKELYKAPHSVACITKFAHDNNIITQTVAGKQLVKLHKVFVFVADMQGLRQRQHAGQ